MHCYSIEAIVMFKITLCTYTIASLSNNKMNNNISCRNDLLEAILARRQ